MRTPRNTIPRAPETLADHIAEAPVKAGIACAVLLLTALALGNAHSAIEDSRRALDAEAGAAPTGQYVVVTR